MRQTVLDFPIALKAEVQIMDIKIDENEKAAIIAKKQKQITDFFKPSSPEKPSCFKLKRTKRFYGVLPGLEHRTMPSFKRSFLDPMEKFPCKKRVKIEGYQAAFRGEDGFLIPTQRSTKKK